MPLDFAADAERIRQRAMQTLLAEFADLFKGIVIVDRQARIVWMNDSYPKRLGLSDPATAIGQPIEEVIPNSLMRDVVSSGRPIMLDIMDYGSESFVVMRLPLHDEAGEIIGAMGMLVFDDPRQLAPVLSRFNHLRVELADTKRKLDEARRSKYTFASLIGCSQRAMAIKDQARRAARTRSPVLILGETGTGKELLAHAIHAASPRASGPFVAVNIAAIPETLLETEFFGVAPGAYTGAERKGRKGKFELAEGGTLFLDEIGDMSSSLQVKLLRALQEKEIEPVGSNQLLTIDVHVIAATSRHLQQDVDAGRFRADLYYRLNVITLDIPPLRDRLDDLPLIAEALTDSLARQLDEPPRSLSPAALDYLARHSWPGNIRELANVLERALLMSDAELLDVEDIERVLPNVAAPTLAVPAAGRLTLQAIQQQSERDAIVAALDETNGNKTLAARRLGISRASLYEKMAALGIDSAATH
ncbi:MAG TPA: sigma 54-interacting transcriptional regulator [Accumulibacter sp.]|jgi:transcriptional regulator with PAS, ATPase and Fis domain|nr:sigma 54-interacting transcriptional regulator [Accumulibacter sp.]